jgi:hypothetical protein
MSQQGISQARVAVIVPTYNRADMLRQCLESLLGQTLPLSQIIVVDDGSTDHTVQCVRSFGSAVSYLHQVNGGKPKALNLALPLVDADYVWIFDDDDIALPSSVELRVTALQRHPHAGFVVTNHLLGKADGEVLKTAGRARWPTIDGDFFLQLMLGCFVTLQSVLVRTACYRQVGGFDENLRTSEDYEMLLRLARRFPVVLLDEPTFIFRQHEGTRGQAAARYGAGEREQRFAQHDAIVGRRLRAELSLGDYLAPRKRGPLGVPETAQALINRMSVMASKGLASELLEDALAFAEIDAGAERLRDHERRQLVRAVQHRYFLLALLAQGSRFLHDAQVVAATARGRSMLRCFARGLVGLARWSAGTGAERFSLLAIASRLAALSLTRPQFQMTT